MIMVGANMGIMKMTREHIFLCKTLDIPFCIVITKIDMVKECSNVMEETLQSITNLMKKPGIGRIPIIILVKMILLDVPRIFIQRQLYQFLV